MINLHKYCNLQLINNKELRKWQLHHHLMIEYLKRCKIVY
jgi:hypothetical protein